MMMSMMVVNDGNPFNEQAIFCGIAEDWFAALPNFIVARDAGIVLRMVLDCLGAIPAEHIHDVVNNCMAIAQYSFGKGLGIQLHAKYVSLTNCQ